MTTDKSGTKAAASYAPGDSFFVSADLSGLPAGSVVEARWHAMQADGWEPNFQINTSDYAYQPGTPGVYFQLDPSGSDVWPTGTYRVELFLNGVSVGEQSFSVQ